MSSEDRVASLTRQGWRAQTQLADRVILTRTVKYPPKINRWIHFIAILMTGGLWTFIWVLDELNTRVKETTEVFL